MNANHDLERRVADFYASEAPARAPDWVLRSAFATIETTPQRRAPIRVPWRFPIMSFYAKLAVAAVAVVAVGAVGLAVLRPAPGPGVGNDVPSPSPVQSTLSSPWPGGSELTQTFTSPMHGLSISYPADWVVLPATDLWTTGMPSQSSGTGDVIHDRSNDNVFLGLASQPLADKTAEEWTSEVLADPAWENTCPPRTEPVTVDGASGVIAIHCPDDGVMTAVVTAQDRGYLVILYGVGDLARFREILATVRLDPKAAIYLPRSFAEATGSLEPGRYVFNGEFPIRFSLAVPPGWGDPDVNATGGGLRTPAAGADNEVLLAFWLARNVYADACDPDSELDPPVGPTADDFVEALEKMESVDAARYTSVSIDGFEARHLELTRSVECPGDYRLWTVDSFSIRRGDVGQGDPPTDEVWIVDVDGTRLVIDLIVSPGASPEDIAEGRAMVESIDFDAAPGS